MRDADVVSCATLSTVPLVLGNWLKPGTHVDLVGAYKRTMRETDDEVMRRADLIVVDSRDGALAEGGDVIQAIASGAISAADVVAELRDFARGAHPGRTRDDQITVFKSVGFALEDLAAARSRSSPASVGRRLTESPPSTSRARAAGISGSCRWTSSGTSPNTTFFGTLNRARCCWQWAMSSASVTAAPGFNSTNAHGVSPHLGSGCATTAAVSTSGWRYSASSTSIELMFSPPEMMMSFERSLIFT